MSERKNIEPVEDYTDAFLCSFGVLLFSGFCIITVRFGFMATLITAAILDLGLKAWVGRGRGD